VAHQSKPRLEIYYEERNINPEGRSNILNLDKINKIKQYHDLNYNIKLFFVLVLLIIINNG
jgi:hypothetical protein